MYWHVQIRQHIIAASLMNYQNLRNYHQILSLSHRWPILSPCHGNSIESQRLRSRISEDLMNKSISFYFQWKCHFQIFNIMEKRIIIEKNSENSNYSLFPFLFPPIVVGTGVCWVRTSSILCSLLKPLYYWVALTALRHTAPHRPKTVIKKLDQIRNFRFLAKDDEKKWKATKMRWGKISKNICDVMVSILRVASVSTSVSILMSISTSILISTSASALISALISASTSPVRRPFLM